MPALSATQPRLKEHEQWLIGLRQDPHMTLAKIRTELENQKGVKATYVLCQLLYLPLLIHIP